MTATLGATFTAAMATSAEGATPDDFSRLRMCESGGNYQIDTGNGFYGAYQFDLRTWHGLGYGGKPSQAAPGTQDAAARTLQSERGWQPWPACSRRLGLGSEPRASRGGRALATRHTGRPAVTPVPAPTFSGVSLTTDLVGEARSDVRAWQLRMVARGWDLAVDGRYGPRTAHVAARFAAEKGLKTAPGTVDKAVWNAAWEAPVS
jgi:hypothetical protein